MPRLSEYELQRLEKIKQNQELMKSLGILEGGNILAGSSTNGKATSKLRTNLKETTNTIVETSRIKRKQSEGSPSQTEPRRKSARLAGSSKDLVQADDFLNSDPIDFLSTPKKKPHNRHKNHKLHRHVSVEEEIPFDNDYRAPLPERDRDGTLLFNDKPSFRPNLSPEEVLNSGSFGGTLFSRHYSRILQRELKSTDYQELPEQWYTGLQVDKYLTSPVYDSSVNKYGVKAGQSLTEWENAGWVHEQDPRGWFQWYYRFYLGRRSKDDDRQIKRWIGVCGSTGGRFKNALVKKIVAVNGEWNDWTISPIIRQTLQHWGYSLSKSDYLSYF